MPKTIKYYMIDDYSDDSLGADLNYEGVANNEEAKKRIFQFTSLLHNPINKKLYCGLTNFSSDIFYEFDVQNKTFKSLNYKDRFAARSRFDIKIHRSLEFDAEENCIYAISSGLHAPKDYNNAPGSHLFKYDCSSDSYEDLGMPLEHEYTQTITLDKARGLIYGFTLDYFSFYVYDLKKRQTIFHCRPESITHVSAIDDSGCIWSTWHRKDHKLFKYDPAENKCTYFEHGFPEKANSLMYPGAGPIDRMINIGDGYLYVALETGSLYRIDPKTAQVEFLGKGAPIPRLPGLTPGIKEDTLLCVTGDLDTTLLMEYHLKQRTFTTICEIVGEDRKCFRPHDIAVIDNVVYVAETDNPKGVCCLWEITL
jgi:hypothetical protein